MSKRFGVLLLSVLMVLSVFAVAPVLSAKIESVNAPNVAPGGQTNVSIQINSSTGLSLTSIPLNLTVDGQTTTGNSIFVTNDQNSDGHNESVGWSWTTTGLHTAFIEFNVSDSAAEKDYEITVNAINGVTASETFNITVTQSITDIYDTNPQNGQIDNTEVQQAIKCFLFDTNCIGSQLTNTQVQTIIKAFLGFT